MTLKKWTRPACYIGATWEDYYAFLSRNRDSDCLENSNFECGLAAVKAVASKDPISNEDDSATVRIVRESHWACGWVEWIAIHESDKAALVEAEQLCERLDNYPVLDEDDFSEREMNEANEVWKNCYRPKERVEYIRKHRSQFDFRDYADLSQCVRGKYFAGYANELIH